MEDIVLHIPPFEFPRNALIFASWHMNSICTDFPRIVPVPLSHKIHFRMPDVSGFSHGQNPNCPGSWHY